MAWWQDVITQAFNPPVEPGVDVGTPFHTPITALAPGKVVAETFGGWGARVDIQTGAKTVEYYQHLDTIAPGVTVGSQVTAGEQLGLSGGQLSGGSHPNSPLNSSGPHVEFGVVTAGVPQDPAATLSAGITGVGSGAGAATGSGGNWLSGLLSGLGFVAGSAAGSTAGAATTAVAGANPYTAAGQALGSVAGSSTSWVRSNIIPLIVAALIILVVLGAGQKTVQAPAAQIIPVPV